MPGFSELRVPMAAVVADDNKKVSNINLLKYFLASNELIYIYLERDCLSWLISMLEGCSPFESPSIYISGALGCLLPSDT
jgi:hypothetical protein